MKTIQITNKDTHITESCHIYDDGALPSVDIDIQPGIAVQYFFTAKKDEIGQALYRHIFVHENASFVGTSVIIDTLDLHITTEIV